MDFDTLAQFHFLRPEFLLGLIALPLLWYAFSKKGQLNNDWSKAIDPALLHHLTPTTLRKERGQHSSLILLALALSFVALSGPTWEEKPQPVSQINDDMVVILDLSLSMLATDTSPDRLTKAKQKLQDLLTMRKEGATALIAFSGDSHVVTPLTDDTNTIIANLPALDPLMMPVVGSRPDLAVEQAMELLRRAGANRGRIVMLSDGVAAHQAEKIQQLLEGRPISLLILAAGTAQGGPIKLPDQSYLKDGGNVVLPQTDFRLLAKLANSLNGTMMPLSLDDTDLKALDIAGSELRTQASQELATRSDQGFDRWEDMGYALLLLVIPLVLLAHRQGAFLLVVLFVFPVNDGHAFDLEDVWQTPDQRAQAMLERGEAAAAAELFESHEHKAYANYKAGQYEAAASLYRSSANSRQAYNQGNALAQQQDFQAALEAYQTALELDPSNEDARYNKKLIEDYLQQQSESQDSSSQDQSASDQQNDQQNKQQPESDKQQTQDQSQPQQGDSSEQNEPSRQDDGDGKNEETSPEEDLEQQESTEDKEPDSAQAQAEQNDETAQPDDQSEGLVEQKRDPLSEEEKQSYEQWMRRVPDDPGGLLRRKFEQQARERNRINKQDGEPLW